MENRTKDEVIYVRADRRLKDRFEKQKDESGYRGNVTYQFFHLRAGKRFVDKIWDNLIPEIIFHHIKVLIIFISTQYLHGYRSCTGTPAAEHCIIFRIYRIVGISASEIYGKEVADKLVLWVCLLFILNQNVNYIRKGSPQVMMNIRGLKVSCKADSIGCVENQNIYHFCQSEPITMNYRKEGD